MINNEIMVAFYAFMANLKFFKKMNDIFVGDESVKDERF